MEDAVIFKSWKLLSSLLEGIENRALFPPSSHSYSYAAGPSFQVGSGS